MITLTDLLDDVKKWGVEHTGNEPSISCFYRAFEELKSYVTRNEQELSGFRMQCIYEFGQEQDGEPLAWLYSDMTGWKQAFIERQAFSKTDGVDFEICETPLFDKNSAQSNTDKPLPLLNQKWSKESEIINQAGFDKLNADKPELTHEKNVQIRKQSFHRFNNSMIGDVDAN
jgi:hypothetical protein